MAAMSDKGLATAEFGPRRSTMAEADVVNSQEELTEIIGKLGRAIEGAGSDPGAPLD